MYCPKCSHQTVSTSVRFCPGCGFRLESVAELLANNGVFAANDEKPRRSMVKRGALLGATLMFIGGLFAIVSMIGYDGPDQRAGLVALFFSWVALVTLIAASGYLKRLVSNIFTDEAPSPSKKIASPRGPSLPAAYSAPGADSGHQLVDTAKMAQPSSVTEQTTSRLNTM
jgi:hypothetical protein